MGPTSDILVGEPVDLVSELTQGLGDEHRPLEED